MSLSKATCCFAPSLSTHREQAGFFLINTKMFKKTKEKGDAWSVSFFLFYFRFSMTIYFVKRNVSIAFYCLAPATASFASCVIRAQSPDSIASSGASHEPPTHLTLLSAK